MDLLNNWVVSPEIPWMEGNGYGRYNWEPQHVTIGLFEAIETIDQAMAVKLEAMLDKYESRKKYVTCVKDEGVILGTMTTTLKYAISCDNLGL